MDVVFVVLLVFVGIVLLSLVMGSFFTVNTAQVAVITRFGKFLARGRGRAELEGAVFRFRGRRW